MPWATGMDTYVCACALGGGRVAAGAHPVPNARLRHGADEADLAPARAGLHLAALAYRGVGHGALVHGAGRLRGGA